MMNSHHAVLFAFLLLVPTVRLAAEPQQEGQSRLRLERPETIGTESTMRDPYDDLGDFVATYSLRYTESLRPGNQSVLWGTYQVRRRGDWISATYDLEYPSNDPERGIEPTPMAETWVFYRRQFKGVVHNNILTLDPSDSPPTEPMPPFTEGLGWSLDHFNRSQPSLIPAGAGQEAFLGGLGWGPEVVDGVVDGVESATRFRSPDHPMMPNPEDVTGPIRGYRTTWRAAVRPEGEERSFLRSELGVEIPALGDAPAFRVPKWVAEVGAWRGKFPQEMVVTTFRRNDDFPFTRAGLAAFAATPGRDRKVHQKWEFRLQDVREPHSGDLIEMRDMESRVEAVRQTHGLAPEAVAETAADGTEVARWRLDENSQMWERVAAN